MRCDDLRKALEEGAPLDGAIRGHLDACAACGEEFAAIRALTASRPTAPPGLRDRVLAGFPARRAPRWAGLARAAAVLLVGLAAGFAAAWTVKAPAVVERDRFVVKEVQVVQQAPLAMPMTDDDTSVLAISLERVYGKRVRVVFKGIQVEKIEADKKVMEQACQYCPVARGLFRLAEERPELVTFR